MQRSLRYSSLIDRCVKHFSTSAVSASNESAPFYFHNRNPRNLQKLRIEKKPLGYHLDKKGNEYWYKLVLKNHRSSRAITAEVVHNSGQVIVSASTNEWAVSQFLYSKNDTAAYMNIGRVLAQRCLETGISETACFFERIPNTKADAFLTELEKGGILLTESEVYAHPKPSDPFRPEKPWEVY